MNRLWLSSFFFLCIFLVACSNDTIKESANSKNDSKQEKLTGENKEVIKLVASENKSISNFSELAFVSKESPHSNYLVNKVDNQKSYEEAWELYRLEQQIETVNFEKNDVYFIGVFESGWCDNIKKSIDNQVMNIHLSAPDRPCISIATPKTIVIEVSKESSSDLKNIVIEQDNVETMVPINELINNDNLK